MPALAPVSGVCPEGSMETAEFCVTLDDESQTLTSLRPKADTGFDFAPSDRLAQRSGNGFVQLGDVNLRVRPAGEGTWQNASTSVTRAPVTVLNENPETLSRVDLGPTLPALPVGVTREWTSVAGRLALRFTVTNESETSVEIGALGIPLVFNNIITSRSLEEAHETCSFSDPYIGNDAGYVQVTRLDGSGPALLVLPEAGTPLEAYGELLNLPTEDSGDPEPVFFDVTPRNQTFEGFHQWMAHTRAFAENEWAGIDTWNIPTSATLEPGESRTYGLRFVLTETIRSIESTLEREQQVGS